MKNVHRLLPLVAGFIGVCGAWGVVAVGCGSSSGGGGSPDSGSDTTTDSPSASDAPTEAAHDGGQTGEAGHDAEAGEGGVQAEAGNEGGAVDAEAGVTDSGAVPTADTFPALVATALCSTWASCCGTAGDAATFNWQQCYGDTLPMGLHGSSVGATLYANGNISFDEAKAQACLNAISAVDCTANQISGTAYAQMYQDCYEAYTGTLTAGATCAATIECSAGNYCSPVGDGSTGICTALAGQGGACGVLGNTQNLSQTVCSYRGAASNGLFCQNVEPDASNTQLPLVQWTCQPQWGVGTGCWTTQDCSSFICHEYSPTDYECASAGNWANTTTCTGYVIPGADN